VQLLNILYPNSADDVEGGDLPVLELADAITGETTLCTVEDSNAFEWSSVAGTAPTTTFAPSAYNPNELAMFSNFFSDPSHKTFIVAAAVGGFLLVLAVIAFVLYFSKSKKKPSAAPASLPLLGAPKDDENDAGSSTDSELYADLLEDRPLPAPVSGAADSSIPPVPSASAIV
jgi:hypothetical protein